MSSIFNRTRVRGGCLAAPNNKLRIDTIFGSPFLLWIEALSIRSLLFLPPPSFDDDMVAVGVVVVWVWCVVRDVLDFVCGCPVHGVHHCTQSQILFARVRHANLLLDVVQIHGLTLVCQCFSLLFLNQYKSANTCVRRPLVSCTHLFFLLFVLHLF